MKLSINAGLLLLCSSSADAMKLYSPPSWSVRADMPYSASDLTATTVGAKIYIVGGCTGAQEYTEWQVYGSCSAVAALSFLPHLPLAPLTLLLLAL